MANYKRIKGAVHNSTKEMIEALFEVARNKNHPDYSYATNMINQLWKVMLKSWAGVTLTKKEEEKIKVIFT